MTVASCADPLLFGARERHAFETLVAEVQWRLAHNAMPVTTPGFQMSEFVPQLVHGVLRATPDSLDLDAPGAICLRELLAHTFVAADGTRCTVESLLRLHALTSIIDPLVHLGGIRSMWVHATPSAEDREVLREWRTREIVAHLAERTFEQLLSHADVLDRPLRFFLESPRVNGWLANPDFPISPPLAYHERSIACMEREMGDGTRFLFRQADNRVCGSIRCLDWHAQLIDKSGVRSAIIGGVVYTCTSGTSQLDRIAVCTAGDAVSGAYYDFLRGMPEVAWSRVEVAQSLICVHVWERNPDAPRGAGARCLQLALFPLLRMAGGSRVVAMRVHPLQYVHLSDFAIGTMGDVGRDYLAARVKIEEVFGRVFAAICSPYDQLQFFG